MYFPKNKFKYQNEDLIFDNNFVNDYNCYLIFRRDTYNWTSNAQYNNESITITEGREVAEDFANQFIQLRNQKDD